MGSPDHYGVELPSRCLKLLDAIWANAEQVFPDHEEELGPLTATFLLSMAIPIVNLPIERIERRNGARFDGYIDDRNLDPKLSERMHVCLGNQKIQNAPFFLAGAWSYFRAQLAEPINISDGFPDEIAIELARPDAVVAASTLPGSQWSSILRNSMAHGGVVYLDADGRTARHRPAKFFVFVSGRFDRDDCGRPIKLNSVETLRVSIPQFREFLRAWVSWLNGKPAVD
ncbi:hypothetical protein [Pseudogemmobacter humi]|uniref:Uncharacterized protein n=1 Tax=Pseudogemmobacter humi TaxID=2483812 RepID=A0A3P5X065_9RHOB|nr:hypothetical protein [Pseudogemmobacter humi]VDC27467.1 hypothetical protein XINFAN_01888 [Pseudogemmobacter humi]